MIKNKVEVMPNVNSLPRLDEEIINEKIINNVNTNEQSKVELSESDLHLQVSTKKRHLSYFY